MAQLITVPQELFAISFGKWIFLPPLSVKNTQPFDEEKFRALSENPFVLIYHKFLSNSEHVAMVCKIDNLIGIEGRLECIIHPLFRARATSILRQEGDKKFVSWEAVPDIAPPPEVFEKRIFQDEIRKLFRIAIHLIKIQGKQVEVGKDFVRTAEDREMLGRWIDSIICYWNVWIENDIVAAHLAEVALEPDVEKRLLGAVELGEAILNAFSKEEDGEEQESTNESVPKVILPTDIQEKTKPMRERLKGMGETSEASVLQNYLNWVDSLPWNISTEDTRDLNFAKQVLDEDHCGLEKAKDAILNSIAVRNMNPDVRAEILCFVGPPGTGKTSLGQSIARALGKKLVHVSLGGVRDEADIRGHRRIYVAALPGRIISGIKKAGSNNPVFMLDEMDKIGHDFRGDPADALLEVLDPKQNQAFVDHYLGDELPFNLSKVLFIGTANVTDTIPLALLDRMNIIVLPGYTEREKMTIARKFLIPKQLKEYGLTLGQLSTQGKPGVIIEFVDEALEYIIRRYTSESGVRDIEKKIGSVLADVCRAFEGDESKKYMLKTNWNVDKTHMVLTVDVELVQRILGNPHPLHFQKDIASPKPGVVPFLAVMGNGMGVVEFVEVWSRESRHMHIERTGSQRRVIKESVKAALTRARQLHWPKGSEKRFVHVHMDNAATAKDGPSAGVMIHVAMYSDLHNIPVKPFFTGTGEITLRRDAVDVVGGIPSKLLAAMQAGIREVFIPSGNENDLTELSPEILASIDIIKETSCVRLSEISRMPKDRFTVYCIDTPEQALAIAFPNAKINDSDDNEIGLFSKIWKWLYLRLKQLRIN